MNYTAKTAQSGAHCWFSDSAGIIARAKTTKVADIVGSDAEYGALRSVWHDRGYWRSHKYFVSKSPFPQQFSTISEKFPDIKRTNRVNGDQFPARPSF